MKIKYIPDAINNRLGTAREKFSEFKDSNRNYPKCCTEKLKNKQAKQHRWPTVKGE